MNNNSTLSCGITGGNLEKYQSFLHSCRSCVVEIAITLLTTFVIMVISANYLNYDDHFSCNGGLGAGFPVSFLCDYGGGGGSPISSWGKIDLADFPYFSPQGLLVDILFYSVILWIAWLVRYAIYHKGSYHHENYRWMTLISIAFIVGFISALLIFQSNRLNFQNYILGIPTPIISSPTPLGTMPSAITPIATPAP